MEPFSIDLRVTAPMVAKGNSDQIAVTGLRHLGANSVARRWVAITLGGTQLRLALGDHGSFWLSHQPDDESLQAFNALHRRLLECVGVQVKAIVSDVTPIGADQIALANPARVRSGRAERRATAADEGRVASACIPFLTPGPGLDPLPDVIVHADWSFGTESKRQWVRALRGANGYVAEAPRSMGAVREWLDDLVAVARAGKAVLAGFDFALGVPAAYAAAAPRQVRRFVELLEELPPTFWQAGDDPMAVSWARPFFSNSRKGWGVLEALLYPGVPRVAKRRKRSADSSESKHAWLAKKILGRGDATTSQLLRLCEQKHARRPEAASPLFLLSGAAQVGKASLSGWREIVLPALREHRVHVNLWPFDGQLHDLVRPGNVTIVETYPAEAYGHLGIAGKDKKNQKWRDSAGELMLRTVAGKDVTVAAELGAAIADGFGPSKDGEDPFDAVAGLLSMALIALGHDTAYEPVEPVLRNVEGWIFGRPSAST